MATTSDTRNPTENPETTATESRAGTKSREMHDAAAQEVRKIAAKAAQAADSAGEIALDASQRAVAQAEENVALGMKAIRDMQGSLAEAALERTQRMIEMADDVASVYRDTTRRTADEMQALMSSFHSMGGGVQQWQRTYVEWMTQSLERFARKSQLLANAASPLQVAEVQRDMVLDAFTGFVTANSSVLQLAAQTAQESVRPLQYRVRTHAGA